MGTRLTLRPFRKALATNRQFPHQHSVPTAVDGAASKVVDAGLGQREATGALQSTVAALYDACGTQAYALAIRLLAGERQQAEGVVYAEIIEICRALPGPENLDISTLCRITLQRVRHRCIDLLRSAEVAHIPLSADPVTFPGVTEDAATRPTPARVREALTSLSFEQRAAIDLAYLDGRTSDDIASRTCGTVEDVNRRLRSGLHHLMVSMSMDGAEKVSR